MAFHHELALKLQVGRMWKGHRIGLAFRSWLSGLRGLLVLLSMTRKWKGFRVAVGFRSWIAWIERKKKLAETKSRQKLLQTKQDAASHEQRLYDERVEKEVTRRVRDFQRQINKDFDARVRQEAERKIGKYKQDREKGVRDGASHAATQLKQARAELADAKREATYGTANARKERDQYWERLLKEKEKAHGTQLDIMRSQFDKRIDAQVKECERLSGELERAVRRVASMAAKGSVTDAGPLPIKGQSATTPQPFVLSSDLRTEAKRRATSAVPGSPTVR